MKVTTFTDTLIRKLKPTDKKFIKGEGNGFNIRVMPSGVRTWLYLYTFDGKRKEMNLGTYPAVTLETARERFDAAKKRVKNGFDPLEEKEREKQEHLNAYTVSKLAEEYINRWAKVVKRSWKKDEAMLNRDVIPVWGKRKAADITKRDVNLVLRGIVDRGAPIMARNTLAVIRKMFNWGVAEDILQGTPCLGVKASSASTPRKRHLSDEEIKTLWQSLERTDLSMTPDVRRALKLVLVTAQRPGEVSGMHTRELNGHWWTIPAERAKNKTTHRVYLTDTALALIGSLTVTDKKTGEVSDKGYVFPSPIKKEAKPLGNTALAVAVIRNLAIPVLDKKGKPVLDSKGQAVTDNRLGVAAFSPHDLRRTAATLLAELKIRYEDRERVLNHKMGKMDGTYNQHDFDDEKQIALETLERKLKSVIAGKQDEKQMADVIPLNSGRKRA